MDIEGENLEKTKEIETMQSISSYINPNTRGLTSNYKNTAIKDVVGIPIWFKQINTNPTSKA